MKRGKGIKEEELESNRPEEIYSNEEAENLFVTYDPLLHGELTNENIEKLAVKLAGAFTAYELYELLIENLIPDPRLLLLLDFMGLEVVQQGNTYFTVTRKDLRELLRLYDAFKARGEV